MQVLYPAVSRAARKADGKARQLLEHSLEEHDTVEELLDELADMDPSDARFMRLGKKLIRNVRHHVREEESLIFPLLRRTPDRRRGRHGPKMG
jgi:hemerythrin superfamily protein